MARVFFVRNSGPEALWVTDGTPQGTHRVGAITDADNLVNVNGALFLSASDGSGTGLWMVDGGTEALSLVQTVNMNSVETNVDGTLFFRGVDQQGFALWKSDGTSEGTGRVSTITPGGGSLRPDSMNGPLLIAASDSAHGLELWRSDGTQAGTVLVRDIRPGSGHSDPYLLREVNGTWFFWANDGVHGYELWKTDGTNAGTLLVEDIWPGSGSGIFHVTSGVIDDALIFMVDDGVHGTALWRSDGTEAGTSMIADINPGPANDLTNVFATTEDLVFFWGTDGVHGWELWRTDGTANGTFMVADINPSTSVQQDPPALVAVGNTAFFWQDDGIHGVELWKSDGTAAGTSLVADITQGPASSYAPAQSTFFNYAVADGELYFSVTPAGSFGPANLWKTDGTPEGTILLANGLPLIGEIVAVENDGIHGGPGSDYLNGTEAGETLAGKAGNDGLTALGGNDVLDGGKGADVMVGGNGDDTYIVDQGGDTVTEHPGQGTDEVRTVLATYTLRQNVENLTFVGSGVFAGFGNGSNNVITGGNGADVLDGHGGVDDLRGGAGSDLYYVQDIGDSITEGPSADVDYVIAYVTYTLPANVEAIYTLDGSGATGNNDGNLLFGAYAQHGLVLDGAGGTDTIYGTFFADTLKGGAASDALHGLDGNDTMQGGAGDDAYYVDQAGDVVQENPGEGGDVIYAQVNYALPANVEMLIPYGAATVGTGNGDANVLLGVGSEHGLTLDGQGGNDVIYGSNFVDMMIGGADNDFLWGFGGDDTMQGGEGNDVYIVEEAGDAVQESSGEGNDTIYASANITLPDDVENLFVYGAATSGTGTSGNNLIANIFITSGVTLTGAGGNDTFVFIPGAANFTIITDFEGNGAAAGDVLQFAAYGPGATFTNINPTQWQVNYGAGLNQHDLITFSNSAAIDASDFLFV